MAMRISVIVGMKANVTTKATSACIPTSTDRNIPYVNPYAIKPSTMAMASRLANDYIIKPLWTSEGRWMNRVKVLSVGFVSYSILSKRIYFLKFANFLVLDQLQFFPTMQLLALASQSKFEYENHRKISSPPISRIKQGFSKNNKVSMYFLNTSFSINAQCSVGHPHYL